jgi:hypothetical protein
MKNYFPTFAMNSALHINQDDLLTNHYRPLIPSFLWLLTAQLRAAQYDGSETSMRCCWHLVKVCTVGFTTLPTAKIDRIIISGQNHSNQRNLSHCHSVHHKSHTSDLDLNTDLQLQKPVTNILSHRTALVWFNSNCLEPAASNFCTMKLDPPKHLSLYI